ncbi:uncharacterized protein [Rutidosis leptorrhynchoides]|uniref:uncharacterized protein n=1 Tax=Rutidosis leptorrhynchoides TaxID=125765 RepID=UPI003A993E32
MIRFHNPDIFAIQESKRKNVNDNLIEIIWAIKGRWVGKISNSIIVNVYGPHTDNLKQKFWDSLESIMQVGIDDWIICGDFNEVRRESERKNCVFIESRAKMFNDFIDKSNLVEIPLGACITKWGDIAACTLDRKYSDHCPIILKVCTNDFGPRPTWVFNNWFEDVECEELIEEAWKLATRNSRADCIVRDKLKKIKLVLKEKCDPKYNTLNVEIDNLQKEVAKWENLLGSRDLTESEISLWLETRKNWLQKDKQKAEILKQKSRIKWATDGDENIKYFHSCIKRRQNKNNIRGISLNGLWIEDPDTIKLEAFKHFQERFRDTNSRRFKLRGPLEKSLTSEEANFLETPFSLTEIFNAINDVGVKTHPVRMGLI